MSEFTKQKQNVLTKVQEKNRYQCQAEGCTMCSVIDKFCVFHHKFIRYPQKAVTETMNFIYETNVNHGESSVVLDSLTYQEAFIRNRILGNWRVDDKIIDIGETYNLQIIAIREYNTLNRKGLIPENIKNAINSKEELLTYLCMRNRIYVELGGLQKPFNVYFLTNNYEKMLLEDFEDTLTKGASRRNREAIEVHKTEMVEKLNSLMNHMRMK